MSIRYAIRIVKNRKNPGNASYQAVNRGVFGFYSKLVISLIVDFSDFAACAAVFVWRCVQVDNRTVTGKKISESVSVERNANGTFAKGTSGNPGGRPKKTPEEQMAIDMMKKATPEMVDLVLSIARSEKSSFYAKLQAAELILNRSMGKPETYLRVENAEESQEEAAVSLLSLFNSLGEENADVS